MVEFPSGWVQQFGVNLVTAFPPQMGARFRYHERLRPQPRFSTIVQRMLAADPEFKVHHVGEMVRVVTREGEYGAWVPIEGRREGSRARRFVGAVFMDDFATALDGIAVVPEHFAAVEQLSLEILRSDAFHMAARPRPFFYVPPVGWHGIPSGTTANWYPLDFPRNLTNLVVPPAMPVDGDGAGVVESACAQLGAGLEVDSSVRQDLTSASGVKGTCVHLVGHRAGRQEPIYREMAVFVVTPYAYRMRLETTMAATLLELPRGVPRRRGLVPAAARARRVAPRSRVRGAVQPVRPLGELMRLSLTFPAAWDLKEAPGEHHAAVLPGGAKPDAIVTFGPLVIKPDEPRRWIDQSVRSELPRGGAVRVGKTVDLETVAGWPLRLVEAEAPRPDRSGGRGPAVRVLHVHGARRGRDRASREPRADGGPRQGDRRDPRDRTSRLARRAAGPRRAVGSRAAAAAPVARRHVGAGRRRPRAGALARLDAILATGATAELHVRRGGVLLDLKRPGEAEGVFAVALALDPSVEAGWYLRGVALGDLGRHAEAIAAWEDALVRAPDRVDTHYNIAQARFLLKDFEGALAGFRTVERLDPTDFMAGRKIAQCLYALDRHDEGQTARVAFRERWTTSADPRAALISEYVFDQFDGDGFAVHAIETLRPANPAMYPVLVFRALELHGNHEHLLPASVSVETSEVARSAGTPFVLSVTAGREYRVIGTARQLPPYSELKCDVVKLLRDALAARPSA